MFKLTVFLLIISSTVFSDILFSDDFNDGNADGWEEVGDASFQVISGQYNIYGSSGCYGESYNGDLGGIMSVADYSFRASVIPEFCSWAGLVARFELPGNFFMLTIMPDYNMFVLYEFDPYNATLLDQCNYNIQYDELYWLRVEVEGSEIRGKIWTGTPEDEPIKFQLTGSDINQLNAGSIGFGCAKAPSDAELSVYFDDVEVTDELSSELESRTWGIIKAMF